jgi:hypothetical protein
MRSTPCVDGCCGPIFRVMCRGADGVAGVSWIASMVPTWSSKGLFIGVAVLVPVHRIVLSQRMPFPVGRHENAFEVRMVVYVDAEHVPNFAFVPVGGAPDAGNGFDVRLVTGYARFDTQAAESFDGVEVIDDFKARGRRVPIDGGDRTQANVFFGVFQKAAQVDDLGGVGDERGLAESFDGSTPPFS